MYDRSILHVYFITHFNIMYITPNHGIKPYTAFIAHYHVAHDCSILGYKTIFTKLRDFAQKRNYDSHSKLFIIKNSQNIAKANILSGIYCGVTVKTLLRMFKFEFLSNETGKDAG